MKSKEYYLEKLCQYVLDMEDEEIVDLAKEYAQLGYPAYEGIMEGLVKGMVKAGDLYNQEEYYIAELLLCSDAMYNGINVLKDYLDISKINKNKIKAVIGVVEGDTHDIGKNLVKIMMETGGFDMIDLGRDVPLRKFIEVAKEEDAKLICMSSLMTTTMKGMKKVIDMLEEEGLRNKIKVMVGGGPITESFAMEIGADGYSKNAVEAVSVAQNLLEV